MKPVCIIPSLSLVALAASVAGLVGCGAQFTHVKPGQSARQVMEARNAPAPVIPAVAIAPNGVASPGGGPGMSSANQTAMGPAIPPQLPEFNADPSMPASNDVANKVADSYTRGSFAMQAGQNAEAITALEEAVKLDPNFTDAWNKLVKLYERTGNMGKAADAYKKLKRLGQPNGSTGTEPTGGLGLIR
jgi:hypothetical protein